MMQPVSEILILLVPILFASSGALISEYAGITAVFIDGIINFAAFMTFAFSVFTGNPVAGFLIALLFSVGIIFLTALFTERFRANPFLTGLAVNLLVSGSISVLSSVWFQTSGVLLFSDFVPAGSSVAALLEKCPGFARGAAVPVTACLLCLYSFVFRHTHWGMRMYITGSDPEVLIEHGLNPAIYRVAALCTAAGMAACAGSVMLFRLSSFVPNISAGTGWIGIVIALIGRKKRSGVLAASLFFALLSYAGSYLQQMPLLEKIPSALFVSLPYCAMLILLSGMPRRNIF